MNTARLAFVAGAVFASSFSLAAAPVVSAAAKSEGDRVAAAVEGAAGQLIDGPDSEYVDVPGGFRFHRSCVREIPDRATAVGNAVFAEDGTLLARYPPCRYKGKRTTYPPPTVSGWVVDGLRLPDQPTPSTPTVLPWFSHISGTWTVPGWPSLCGFSVRYLFNDLQGSPGGGSQSSILQPVLTYGWTGLGCGYTMANWLVYTDNTSYKGPDHPVVPGDHIEGYVTLDSGTICLARGFSCYWHVGYRLNGIQQDEQVFYSSSLYELAHGGVLEAYGLNFCSEFPVSPTTFVTTSLTQPINSGGVAIPGGHVTVPMMVPIVNSLSPACGYNTVVSGSSHEVVTLSY